jgi:hypothetical protein
VLSPRLDTLRPDSPLDEAGEVLDTVEAGHAEHDGLVPVLESALGQRLLPWKCNRSQSEITTYLLHVARAWSVPSVGNGACANWQTIL